MKEIFDQVSRQCSVNTTKKYSTSFSLGIKLLHRDLRQPIYSIYGFVRFADEIVDTFHGFDKRELLDEFKKDTFKAIERGISLNPILNSFQEVVNQYKIEHSLIEKFLFSMEMDLDDVSYNQANYEEYILGSAEVVGLMCLTVFCNGDRTEYDQLKFSAMKLGSAFQKINFLRDIKEDVLELGRSYFPDVDMEKFSQADKVLIEKDIAKDFKEGLNGIRNLPYKARYGVYLAYMYYFKLFMMIRNTDSDVLLQARVRVANYRKMWILFASYFKFKLNRI